MVVRVRAADWELAALLYSLLRDVLRYRESLRRGGKHILWVLKEGTLGLSGLALMVVGGCMYAAIVAASWQFSRIGFRSVSELVGTTIGAGIAVLIFVVLATYTSGVGIWLMAPRSRPAGFVKRHLFRRPERNQSTAKPVPAWNGLRKRIPAAAILRFFGVS